MSADEWALLCLQANRIDLVTSAATPTTAALAAIKEIEFLRRYAVELVLDINHLQRGGKLPRPLGAPPEYSI